LLKNNHQPSKTRIPIETLGQRICIIGHSSAGKSTLAQHLARRLDLTVCHLDQMAHIPYTAWQMRDRKLMQSDHQAFLAKHESWVIEGNYSYLMPARFAQATVIIWLDFSRWSSIYRYTKRSFQNNKNRAGDLDGATTQFSFKMIKHILITSPKNRVKYQNLIERSGLSCIRIRSFKALMNYYKIWNI